MTQCIFTGKDDIFGDDVRDTSLDGPWRLIGKSMFSVRAISYCDMHKIALTDLREILQVSQFV